MVRTEQFRVKGPDISTDYLLKPIGLSQYVLETFAYHCADLGLASYDLKGISWVMTDFKIDFLTTLPRWREVVELNLERLTVKGLRLFQEFQAKYHGEVIAKGSSGWLIINKKSRRPMPIEEVSDQFTKGKKGNIPDFKLKKLKEN